jgi:hypothetical protein
MRGRRTTEDIEDIQLRARLRLERRARAHADHRLVREAAAVVAALDGRLAENQERWGYGDR